MTYHFRRMVVKPFGIPRNQVAFFSDQLFPESECPVRLFFFIVETKALVGDFTANPFQFDRKWTGTYVSESSSNLAAELGDRKSVV